MEQEIELQIMPSGNVAVYRGNGFIPTEKLTEEERLFVLNKVIKELGGEHKVKTRDLALEAEIKRYNELSKQILKEAEERFKDKNMKIEITINAPVFGEEKMADYLRLFAQMLLTAEGETVSITIDGEAINPYDKYSRPKLNEI